MTYIAIIPKGMSAQQIMYEDYASYWRSPIYMSYDFLSGLPHCPDIPPAESHCPNIHRIVWTGDYDDVYPIFIHSNLCNTPIGVIYLYGYKDVKSV